MAKNWTPVIDITMLLTFLPKYVLLGYGTDFLWDKARVIILELTCLDWHKQK